MLKRLIAMQMAKSTEEVGEEDASKKPSSTEGTSKDQKPTAITPETPPVTTSTSHTHKTAKFALPEEPTSNTTSKSKFRPPVIKCRRGTSKKPGVTAVTRTRIPDRLRETLVDLVIGYFLHRPRPTNLIEYSIKFFRKMQGLPEELEETSEGSGTPAEAETEAKKAEAEGKPAAAGTDPSKPGTEPPNTKKNKKDAAEAEKKDKEKAAVPPKLELDVNCANWLWHLAAKYCLDEPEDIAVWGLEHCLEEKDRWSYTT